MACMLDSRGRNLLGDWWAYRLNRLQGNGHGDIGIGEVTQDVALVGLQSLSELQEARLGLQASQHNLQNASGSRRTQQL